VWRASRAEYTSRQAIAVVAAGLLDSKLGTAAKRLWRGGLWPRGWRLPFKHAHPPLPRVAGFRYAPSLTKSPPHFSSVVETVEVHCRSKDPFIIPVYIVDRCLYYQSKDPMGLQAHADYDLRSRRLQSTSSEAGRQYLPLPASIRAHCSEPTMFRSSEFNSICPSGRTRPFGAVQGSAGIHRPMVTKRLQDTRVACQAVHGVSEDLLRHRPSR
jgi:hypothetical protein